MSIQMHTINLDLIDAGTVHAILMTHAEMQDNRAIKSMELYTRLQRDEPGSDMIGSLKEQIDTFEEDAEVLRALAKRFPSTNPVTFISSLGES